MLEIKNVTKTYKNENACDDISFSLPEGAITVLLGPNGAGKSTLMKCIIGFLKHKGTIEVEGHPSKSIEAKRILGYMPEIPSLYPNLTLLEHMEFVARAYRLTDYEAYRDELLTRFDLIDKKNKFGDELSKGMQQKLSLCCALLPKPRLLLMDEPMIGLDPHAIKELKLLMKEMKAAGQTLLISTHIIDSMDQLWDHAVILQKGKVKGVVDIEEIKRENTTLEEKFFQLTEGLNADEMSLQTGGEETL